MFIMGNFIIRDQRENQEKDGKTSSGRILGIREDGGDEQKTEKNGGVF